MVPGKVKSPGDALFPLDDRLHGRPELWTPQVGTWSAALVYVGVGLLIVSLWRAQPQALTPVQGAVGVAAFALYGVAYAASCVRAWPGWSRVLAVAVMSMGLAVFNWAFAHLTSFTAVSLQIVTALAVTLVVPIRPAFVWIVALSCVLAWANGTGIPEAYALLLYPTYILMNLFAGYMMLVVVRERQQRADLTTLNRELQLARDAAASSAQEAERHRIARDLHDTLGHRLTALSLELEYALQAPAPAAREAVERAQRMNSQLLGEVRQTIRGVRADPSPSLTAAFHALGAQFRVPLDVRCEPEPLTLASPQRDILLQCAREALTNAVRHAEPRRIALRLHQRGAATHLDIENDGCGPAPAPVEYGEGLRGMTERLRAVGGHLAVAQGAGRFVVQIRLPGGAP